MRIIFLGTPEFAVPALERLIDWPEVKVVAVVTQPDRPAGRGNKIFPPPTKLVAGRFNIPVLQPEKLSKAPDVVQAMKDFNPDVLVTVAFGQILKKEVLNMAPHGVINVHGSLLPKYRGAAPINWALINGEKVTGVTTMFSDPGIDTGKMLLKREIPLEANTNAEELAHIMAEVGADVLIDTLARLKAGSLVAIEQDHEAATMAPRLTKEMGQFDWTKSAEELHNLTRGLYPWPGTYCSFRGVPLKIKRTEVVNNGNSSGKTPGTITAVGKHVTVACGPDGKDLIDLLEVQPSSRSPMKAKDWANGAHIKAGEQLQS